jgi:ribosomal protein S18 acetylase RimI-like enzyme
MNEAWTLRPAAPDDAAFLACLFRSTRPELAMLPDGLADMLIAQQQQLQEMGYRHAFPDARTLVIEAAGAPAGKLVLDERSTHVRLVDIAVAPSYRRRGVARAVLGHLQRQAREHGRDVVLSVARENAPALALYRSLGFEEEARDAVRASLRWRAPPLTRPARCCG